MKRSSTIALAAGVLLAGLGLWWLAGVGGTNSTAPASGAGPERTGGQPSAPLDLASAPSGERTSSASETPKPAADLPPEPKGTISGTVVDSKNRGLGGVDVSAVLDVALDADAFDPAAKARERVVARARTDSEGRFALEVAAGRAHELRAAAAGFALGVVTAVNAGEHPTILLRHGAVLSGTARTKLGGRPVAGARVFLVPAGGRSVAPVWDGRTDAKGAYLAENLPPGSHLFYVLPMSAEKLGLSADRVTLAEGETRTLDVSVPDGTIVLGEVRDGGTGLPIAGAEVSPDAFLLVTVRTNEAGHYEFSGIEASAARITVRARAPGYGVYEAGAVPQEGGVIRADFELAKSRGARGRVVSKEGAPVAGATVVAWASARDGEITREDERTARTGDDGHFRLADLRTDLALAIVVKKERFAESVLRTIEAGLADDADLGDVVLSPGASLEGSVSTTAGDPVQGADVTLAPSPCGTFERCPLERYAITDAKGVFRFADLADGTFRIDVEAEGVPPRKEGYSVALSEGEAKRGFRIVVGEGRSIAGRVVDPHGLGVEGAEVELFAAGGGTPSGFTTRSRADGTFQVNGLDAVEYDVAARFRDDYGPPDDRHHLIDARAERVAAGTSELVLELRRAAEIAGRVAGIDEGSELHPFVLAVGGDGRRFAGEHLAANGRFLLRVPAEEYVELRAWSNAPESIARGSATSDPEHPPDAVRTGVRGGDAGVVLYLKP